MQQGAATSAAQLGAAPAEVAPAEAAPDEEAAVPLDLAALLARLPDTKPLAAAQLVAALLRTGPDERVVVFGQWSGVLGAVGFALAEARLPFLSLAGTGLAARLEALRRFGRAGEPRVLLLSSEGHASGINLQCARNVILLHPHCPESVLGQGLQHRSLSEAAAYEAQAIGRVRRFPQTREVCVYRLYVRGTVEEELLAAQGIV